MATGVSRRARERYLESDKEDGPGHCCQDQGHRERIASQAVLPTLQGSRHGAVRKNCVKHTQPTERCGSYVADEQCNARLMSGPQYHMRRRHALLKMLTAVAHTSCMPHKGSSGCM